MSKTIFLTITALSFTAFSCNHAYLEGTTQVNDDGAEVINANITPSSVPSPTFNSPAETTPTPAYVPGEVLVSFKPGTTIARMQEIAAAVKGAIENPKVGQSSYLITLQNKNASVEAAVTKLKTFPEVTVAEPNGIITIPDCTNNPC